jgi:hypothetical protein
MLRSPLHVDARLVYFGVTVAFTSASVIVERKYPQPYYEELVVGEY